MTRRCLGDGVVGAALRRAAALALVAGAATTRVAAATYVVDRTVDLGSITGTIETTGKIGVLDPADIIDWNLKVDADGNGVASGQLLGPLSGGNSAVTSITPPLTATPKGLFFDFSSVGLLQIATPDFAVVWQLQGGLPFQDELIRESQSPLVQAYVVRGPVTEPIASTPPGSFFTVTPCRVFDSRVFELGGPNPLAAGSQTRVAVGGRCEIPTTARTVSLNIAVNAPTEPGHLRLFAFGAHVTLASAINYVGGQTRANNAIAPLGTAGSLGVYVRQNSGSVHVIIDVIGYFE